jgi:RimJ/RimL family protein N-acetyltransferase
VLDSNIRAIKCYEKCGFARYGNLALDGYSFILMEKKGSVVKK